MFLNNIINTIRTKERNNTNLCLHIPKRDVFMRLLYNILFAYAKCAFLIVLSFPNLQLMGVSPVRLHTLLLRSYLEERRKLFAHPLKLS